MIASGALTSANARELPAIMSFSLFIYGLSNLTGPRTAVHRNRIAAHGMAVTIAATLLLADLSNLLLIVLGIIPPVSSSPCPQRGSSG